MSAPGSVTYGISLIGASYRSAPLDLLDRLSVPPEQLPRLLAPFAVRGPDGRRACEGVVLSTCNRTEIYFAPGTARSPETGFFAGLPQEVVDAWVSSSGLSRCELAARLVRRDGWDAAEHLMRVVCGLDSLILGEPQIRGQVARAYAQAQSARAVGLTLSTLFQSAIRGGRRALARIGVATGSHNAGSASVEAARSAVGEFSRARVLVIGTGEIGRQVLHSLRGASPRQIQVVSRSPERASEAAARWKADAHPLSDLPGLLPDCDVLFSTTRSSGWVLTHAMVRAAMGPRSQRPMLLVDLGVPRTIEPAAASVSGVRILDLDSLRDALPRDTGTVASSIALIREDLAELRVRLTELALRPVIRGLWDRADQIRSELLAQARQKRPDLDPVAWALVEDITESLMARILHDPTARLRAEAANGHAASYAEALASLFLRVGLGPDGTGT